MALKPGREIRLKPVAPDPLIEVRIEPETLYRLKPWEIHALMACLAERLIEKRYPPFTADSDVNVLAWVKARIEVDEETECASA